MENKTRYYQPEKVTPSPYRGPKRYPFLTEYHPRPRDYKKQSLSSGITLISYFFVCRSPPKTIPKLEYTIHLILLNSTQKTMNSITKMRNNIIAMFDNTLIIQTISKYRDIYWLDIISGTFLCSLQNYKQSCYLQNHRLVPSRFLAAVRKGAWVFGSEERAGEKRRLGFRECTARCYFGKWITGCAQAMLLWLSI